MSSMNSRDRILQNLLENRRPNHWLLLFLAPVLASQVYFLYLDPQTLPRAVLFNAVLAAEAALIVFTLLRPTTARVVPGGMRRLRSNSLQASTRSPSTWAATCMTGRSCRKA